MIDYHNPNKWLILQYRPGTAGKLFCSALMTIDCIAHWDSSVEFGKISFKEWVDKQWLHKQNNQWLLYEPLHNWDLRFFGRMYPRGHNITLTEFSNLTETHASNYFKQIWKSNKLILDFIHQEHLPIWWQNVRTIKLDAANNCPVHRNFLLEKLYLYNKDTGIGTYMFDHPGNFDSNTKLFKNKFEFGPFLTEEEWYNYIWENDFRLNFKMSNPDFLLTDLLKFETFNLCIESIANTLQSSHNYHDLKYLWKVWINKNIDLIPN